jgi:centromeric protein E
MYTHTTIYIYKLYNIDGVIYLFCVLQVHDLLNPELTQIKIQYDPKSNTTTLVGVKEQVVVNPQQVLALLQSGEAHRHVGSTDMNEKSSRAHTLFKLIIESKKRCDDGREPVRFSTLNLVDLAGSENAKMTNSKGERAKEAKYINQSLLTLSSIIHRLSEEKPNSTKKQHLPYRDSKLTRYAKYYSNSFQI